jgi:hypothetical protein
MALRQIFEELKVPVILVAASFALSWVVKVRHAFRRRESEIWSTGFALVTKTNVHEMKYESLLRISYSYAVPGEPYPIPAEFELGLPSADEAEKWADVLSGKTIPVRFNPASPWKSVLWELDLRTVVHASSPVSNV